jgi:hypothetical protein
MDLNIFSFVITHNTWFTVPGTDTSSDCFLGIGALLFFYIIRTELLVNQYPFMSDQSTSLHLIRILFIFKLLANTLVHYLVVWGNFDGGRGSTSSYTLTSSTYQMLSISFHVSYSA